MLSGSVGSGARMKFGKSTTSRITIVLFELSDSVTDSQPFASACSLANVRVNPVVVFSAAALK